MKLKNELELSKDRLLKVITSVGDFLAYGTEVVKQIEQYCYNNSYLFI